VAKNNHCKAIPFCAFRVFCEKQKKTFTHFHLTTSTLKKRIKKSLKKIWKGEKEYYFCTRNERDVLYKFGVKKNLEKDLVGKQKECYLCPPQTTKLGLEKAKKRNLNFFFEKLV
jgi:hypothetical protein